MSPDDIDPSLRPGEPLLDSLDDGFSPPPHGAPNLAAPKADPAVPPEPPLGPQSPF